MRGQAGRSSDPTARTTRSPRVARFLVATQPITGHVLPAIPMVRELTRRGHEVVWYVGKKFREHAEAAGARFAPYVHARDYDDADYDVAFPERAKLKDLAQIKFDFVHLFMRQIAPQHRDLTAILESFPADVVVGDPSVCAAFTVHERGGPVHAVYNITVLGIPGRDVAPFGLGIWPNGSLLGRWRNAALHALATNVIFRSVSAEMSAGATAVGCKPRKFEGVLLSPYLFLEPTVPSFEYPRTDLPPQVHFVGPLLPEPPAAFTPPAWWPDVAHKTKRVVLVTQGTVATQAENLIAPTLEGLASDDVLVVAAGVKDRAALERTLGAAIPANARVEAFVPFGPLMPHVDAYVTNGGYGGVSTALTHGVPVVTGGVTEDKPEVGNRVAFAGVGINLKTATPKPAQVRNAVRKVLAEPRYRESAKQLSAEYARYDGPRSSADLLERLATTKQAVHRAS